MFSWLEFNPVYKDDHKRIIVLLPLIAIMGEFGMLLIDLYFISRSDLIINVNNVTSYLNAKEE